jgi:dihydrofolate reductase
MITSLIVAASRNEMIGAGGTLPWYLSDDLKRFRRLTRGHAVVVGRLTHEDIVSRLGRPLPERTSVVLSSDAAGSADPVAAAADATGVVWVPSLADGLAAARAAEAASGAGAGEVFVIGGLSVYRAALPHVDRIYLTRVHREAAGDRALPGGWLDGFALVGQEDRPARGGESAYSWLDYVRQEPA